MLRRSGLVLVSSYFKPIIETFKAQTLETQKRMNLWVFYGVSTLGTKSFEEEQFKEEGKLKRRFDAFIIQLVYLFPFYVFLHLYGCISHHHELISQSRVLVVF